MDLETLQVIFDMNTEKIQPKLDALQAKFTSTFDKMTGKSDSASDSMSEGEQKMLDQLKDMTDKTKESMNKMSDALSRGSEQGSKVVSDNFSKMHVNVDKQVSGMLSEIDSKMDQARAAEEKMLNLRSLEHEALSEGDNTGASRFNEQAASAEARMTRFQNRAKALAQELKTELNAIPGELTRIAHGMDANEDKIEAIKNKIKGLEVAEKDAREVDISKGFNSAATKATDKSRAIGEAIQQERAKMQKLIDSSDALNGRYGQLEDRSDVLKGAMNGLDERLEMSSHQSQSLSERFSELSGRLRETASRARSVMSSIGRFSGFSLLTSEFRKLRSDSSSLIGRFAELGNRGQSSMNKISRGSRRARSSLDELKYGLKSLPAQFIVWGIGFEAIQKFTEALVNAAKTNRKFNNSLNQIKANLITAFYPLYETIIPWISDFMNVLAKATGWIAQFSAALFGMSNQTARTGAAGLYDKTKAMSSSSSSNSAATKAIQKENAAITAHNRAVQEAVRKENAAITAHNRAVQESVRKENAAITAHNKAMQEAVKKENAAIRARNEARRKALEEHNADIRAANNKRREAVEEANKKISESNKVVEEQVKAQNESQKKRIEELKKKYEDYKNSLMGFDEINTLDLSKNIPDYTPATAKTKDKETYTPTPTESSTTSDTPTKSYTPEATKDAPESEATKMAPESEPTKSTADAASLPDEVDDAFKKPMEAFQGAADAAKKLKDILSDLYAPIKAAWDKEGQATIDAFEYALKEIERLIEDIGKSFMTVWDNSTGVRVVTDILKLLQTTLKIIGDIAKAFAEAWEDHNAGTNYIRSIFNALDSVLKLLNTIGQSFRKAWNDNNLGEKIAANILKLFTNINKLVVTLATSFRKAWTEGNTGTKLFKAWLTALNDVLKLANDFVNSFKKAWTEGNAGTKLFNAWLKVIKDVGKVIGTFVTSFKKAWDAGSLGTKLFNAWITAIGKIGNLIDEWLKSFKAAWNEADVGSNIFKAILSIIKSVGSVVGNLASQFTKAWKAGKTGQGIFNAIFGIIKNVLGAIKSMASATVTWSKKLNFRPLLNSIKTLLDSIKGITKTVWNGLAWGYKNALLPIAKFTITKALPNFFKLLASVIKVVNSVLKALAPLGKSLFNTFLKPLAGYTGGKSISVLKAITSALNGLSAWINKHQKAVQDFAKVLVTMFVIKFSASTFAKATGALVDILGNAKSLSEYKDILKTLFGKLTGLSDIKKGLGYLGDIWNIAKQKWSTFASTLVDIWEAFKSWSVWGKLAAAAQTALDVAMDLNPYVLIAAAVAAVIVVLVELYKHNKKFRTFCNNIYKNITKWLGDALDWVKDHWKGIINFIIHPVHSIGSWFLNDTSIGRSIKKWSAARLKDASNWAKSVGKRVSDGVKDGKKLITDAGKNIGTWVNNFRKGASSTLKKWGKAASNDVDTGVKDGKKLIIQAGKNIGKWTNDFRKDASSTLSKWSKGLGKTVHTGIANCKILASKAGKKLGGWVNGFRSKASSTLKSWAKGLGKTIHDGTQGAKSLTTRAANDIGGWIRSFTSPTAKKISSWAGSIGGKIAKGLKKGVTDIKRAAANIANGIVGTIGKAVNGVIRGIKWILNHVGASSTADRISYWNVPHFAQGGSHKGGPAIVNDSLDNQYQESYQLPNGQQGIFPAVRNLLVNLPSGTMVKSAKETWQSVPHYANGIGHFENEINKSLNASIRQINKSLSDAVNNIAGITGSIWDDLSHPLSTIKTVVGNYVNLDGQSGAAYSVSKAGMNTIEGSSVDMVKDALKDYADKEADKLKDSAQKMADSLTRSAEKALKSIEKAFSKKGYYNGGFNNEAGLYPLSEGNTPEIILPLNQPSRTMQLMKLATSYMGSHGITMPSVMTNGVNMPSGSTINAGNVGNGVSGMQQAIVNAVMMAASSQSAENTNSQQPIEVTVKLGDETIAKHTVKGVNKLTQKLGYNPINFRL